MRIQAKQKKIIENSRKGETPHTIWEKHIRDTVDNDLAHDTMIEDGITLTEPE